MCLEIRDCHKKGEEIMGWGWGQLVALPQLRDFRDRPAWWHLRISSCTSSGASLRLVIKYVNKKKLDVIFASWKGPSEISTVVISIKLLLFSSLVLFYPHKAPLYHPHVEEFIDGCVIYLPGESQHQFFLVGLICFCPGCHQKILNSNCW